jgi:N-ethylmaleimide reductase
MSSSDSYEMFKFVAKEMNQYGLAYMYVMDGLGFGFHNLCPPLTWIEKALWWSYHVQCKSTRDVAEGMIQWFGASDLAAFGWLYISNPDLVEWFANDWQGEER